MSERNVYEEVKGVIVDRLGVDAEKITPETSFQNDLGADSLDIVELVMEMEDEFGFEISDEEAEELTTVGKVSDFITSKL